jgi:hypothetical protein
MKRIISAAVTLLFVLSLCACGQGVPSKNLDVIGSMTFGDMSILTQEENDRLNELKERKEQLLEAKDEEGLAALKTEWEAFSEPIESYIKIYKSVRAQFFSDSDKELLTEEEISASAKLENGIEVAYRERDREKLGAAIAEWESSSETLREMIRIYRGLERPEFSEDEKSLLSSEQLSKMKELNAETDEAFAGRDVDGLRLLQDEWTAFAQDTKNAKKDYVRLSGFSVVGKWKNIGKNTYGQVQSGAIVVFDDANCNVVSPQDTYAFYESGSNYRLDCTTFLFSDTLSFTVKLVDNDHMDLFTGSGILEMERVG